ncbi:MAG: hypothetical protein IJI10_10600, partial [Eubacterium sp.]|nr:hypothetical protein [Eubacterium sp.]
LAMRGFLAGFKDLIPSFFLISDQLSVNVHANKVFRSPGFLLYSAMAAGTPERKTITQRRKNHENDQSH